MAAIERGQGAPDTVVRGWLAKALTASRGPQWVCGKCGHIHPTWVPVCENCGAFDTLDWKTPSHAEGAGLAESAMLPLIIGSAPEAPTEAPAAAAEPAPPPPAPEPTPPPNVRPAPERPRQRDVDDAVLANAADQARVAGGG
jgi:HemY protein